MRIATGEGYYIDPDDHGYKVLVLTGPWREEFAEVMQDQGITALRLSAPKGWLGSDISFVTKLKFLEGVAIYGNVVDVSPLLEMGHLRSLSLGNKVNTKIDFSIFKQLEDCEVIWKSNWSGIEHCTNLRYLNISSYPREDLTWLASLKKLEELYIWSRKLKSLQGLENLSLIRVLLLSYCTSLADISALGQCKHLKKLDINSCKKIATIPDNLVLETVEEVHFDNCGKIASLAPLAHWRSLQTLSCVDDTNIVDGNLDFLRQLPSLRKVRFGGRAHYSINTDDLNIELKRKWAHA